MSSGLISSREICYNKPHQEILNRTFTKEFYIETLRRRFVKNFVKTFNKELCRDILWNCQLNDGSRLKI